MARKKINTEDKKQRMSVVISPENFNKTKELNINNSKFIDWLLEEYFNKISNEGRFL